MAREVTVELHAGRPAIVRQATDIDADGLRRAARVLPMIAGPGVPEVIEVVDEDHTVRMVTSYTPPIAIPNDSSGVVVVGRAVADVLARAHAAGVVHGQLELEHVVTVAGQPGLVGWDVMLLDDDSTPPGPADDARALGQLLVDLLGAAQDSTAAAVRVLAARALADDADARPTTAAMALALGDLAPRPIAPPLRSAARRRPSRVPLLALIGLVAVGAGWWLSQRLPTTSSSAPNHTRGVAATTTTTIAQEPVAEARQIWPADDVQIDGNVLERDGERWIVGETDDVVAIGDWNCDGTSTPAVLRPRTGEVWTFPSWPTADEALAGHPIETVPEAIRLRVVDDGRCDGLAAVDQSQQVTPIG